MVEDEKQKHRRFRRAQYNSWWDTEKGRLTPGERIMLLLAMELNDIADRLDRCISVDTSQ